MKLKEYKSIDEKRKWFDKHNLIDSPEDLGDFLNDLPNIAKKPVRFRGLSEAKYKMYNSGKRFWLTNELDKKYDSYFTFIKSLINEFKKENNVLSKLFNKLNIPLGDIPILAFIQHYGAPTPLVDFTKNVYVALYFAAKKTAQIPSDGIDNYFSLYYINRIDMPSIQKKMAQNLKKIEEFDWSKYNRSSNSNELEEIIDLFKSSLISLEYFVESPPEAIDENEIANVSYYTETNFNVLNQEGNFIVNPLTYSPLEESFMMWILLLATKENDEKNNRTQGEYNLSIALDFLKTKQHLSPNNFLTCFDIHKSHREVILKFIQDQGIDEDFIYPDIHKMIDAAIKNTLIYA